MKRYFTIMPYSIFILFILFSFSLNAQTWQPLGDDDFNQASYYTATYTNIAIAPDGTAYIGYSDYEHNKKLTVKKYSNGLWSFVGTPGFSSGEAKYVSIAIALDGTPYTACQDFGSGNKASVRKWNGSAWIIVGNDAFSAGAAEEISLKIAPDGTPYAGYKDKSLSSKETVQKFNGTAWVVVGTAGFSAGITTSNSLSIAPDGTPYVAYQDYGNSSKATVKKYDGAAWVDVGTAGFSAAAVKYTGLAIAADGTPYLAYDDYSFSYGKATVQKWNGSAWETVGSAGFSVSSITYIDLAISADGMPYIGYAEGAATTVKKYDGTAWVDVGNVTPPGSGFIIRSQYYISLALSSDGTPYIGYQDGDVPSTIAIVKKFEGGKWVVLGGGGLVATNGAAYPTIAISKMGTRYIGYGDYENENKAAVKRFNGTSWENVGSAVSSSYAIQTFIAMSPADTPYVVYDENTNFGGKGVTVKKFNGTIWETVGNEGFALTGPGANIVFGKDSTPYVGAENIVYRLNKATNKWISIGEFGVPYQIAAVPNCLAVAPDGMLYDAYRSRFSDIYNGNQDKISVGKYDSTSNTWSYVGSQYIGDSTTAESNLHISPDGTLYLCYQDYKSKDGIAGRATVKKFDGTDWVDVGSPRFTPGIASHPRLAIASNGTLYVAYGDNFLHIADNKASVMKFDGTDWVAAGNMELSAGIAIFTELAITPNGDSAIMVYQSGNVFAKSLLIGGPLPIKLLSINASLDNKTGVAINWKVSEDAKSAYYDIQRSYDLRTFTTIGTVHAKGAAASEYIYYDNTAFTGNAKTVFYKLKMVDKDGGAEYSKIVSVSSNATGTNAIIYPVPSVNYIIIKANGAQYMNSEATIYDNAGRLIKTITINSIEQFTDISKLPSGMYYIRLNDGAKLKFQKMR